MLEALKMPPFSDISVLLTFYDLGNYCQSVNCRTTKMYSGNSCHGILQKYCFSVFGGILFFGSKFADNHYFDFHFYLLHL